MSSDVRILCACTELGFFLRGTFYPDNGLVVLSDIGEGSNALYCLTNFTQCCSAEEGGRPRGLWRFPNGNNVGFNSGGNIYSSRGSSSLLLNRQRGGSIGVYKCLIPDAGDVTRTLSINIQNSKCACKISCLLHEHCMQTMSIIGRIPIVSNILSTAPTATTLPITWTVSGSIDRFEVTYSYTVNRCSAPQGAPRTDTISDGSTRSTLRDLNEDSRYTITVRAISTAGSTMETITADTLTSGEINLDLIFLLMICLHN